MLQISETVDLDAVRDYWHAVIEMTMDTVANVTDDTLDETLSEDEVRNMLVIDGVGHPDNALAVLPVYTGWTRLEALYHFSVTHYYWHGGEVRTIEGMLRANKA